jgi:hypothetical protein
MAETTTTETTETEGFDYELYEYLTEKMAAGEALTPEEQAAYDQLMGYPAEGYDLTGTEDFNALYEAFYALADEETKREFEALYGEGLFMDEDGVIYFSRPGSVMEQYMRQGMSINDGPAQAAMSEGLQEYMRTAQRNSYLAMTNSYAAMTPIRAQNIQAATNAGNIASTAAGRRVPIGVASINAGAMEGMEGPGEGEPISIDTRGAGAPEEPGFFDKFGPGLLGILGTGALGIGGYLLKDWYDNRNKPKSYPQSELDRAAQEIVGRNQFTQAGDLGGYDPLNVPESMQSYGMYGFNDVTSPAPNPYLAESQVDPYGGINPDMWAQSATPQPSYSASDYLQGTPIQSQDYFGSPTQQTYSWQTNPNNFVYSDWGTPVDYSQPSNDWSGGWTAAPSDPGYDPWGSSYTYDSGYDDGGYWW